MSPSPASSSDTFISSVGRITPPSVLTRIDLFDCITYLEQNLCELILDTTPEWEDTPVTPHELDNIECRYKNAQAANVVLYELHYV
jgi:hypothetical protein